MIWFIIVILTLQSCTSAKSPDGNKISCPQPKVGHCTCVWNGSYCSVKCQGLDVVPDTLPTQTTHLTMVMGTLKEFPKNYLKKLNNLAKLDLSNNRISNSFYIPRHVVLVNLKSNLLRPSMLHGMFHNLTLLKDLVLSMNPLSDGLIPGTFFGLDNLLNLEVAFAGLKDLQVGTFYGLKTLNQLNVSYNQISMLRKGVLNGIGKKKKPSLSEVYFSENNISNIEDRVFEGHNFITEIHLADNRLTSIPDLKGVNSNFQRLQFSGNLISDLSSLSKSAIKSIRTLQLQENNISVIPPDTFKNINILFVLDLSFNSIQRIPARLFQGSYMSQLNLQNNRISILEKDSFAGLPNLQGLFMLQNELQFLPDSLFENMEIDTLFLSENSFTKLTGRPFKGMNKTNLDIQLFSNPIHEMDGSFFSDIKGTSKTTLDCQNLKDLPRLPVSTQVHCTEHYSQQWIEGLGRSVAKSLAKAGFKCVVIVQENYRCIPCGPGTFGGDENCRNCSAGGFFQDELAQVYCKKCNIGTFVQPKNAPATGPLTCQACPQGTQSSQWSGYRACKCLQNFHRFDRFDQCFPCPSKGLNCSNDYAILSEGYYWEWTNESMKNDYDSYITNLMIESRDYTNGTWTFTGSLPVPHKCPRKSCRGGLNSSCDIGYHGPLCSLCDVGYYNRMNSCISCPGKVWATIRVVLVIVLFILVLLAILWGDKKQVDSERGRTIADKILSCFKIVIGFYQVMSGVYSATTHIEWPSSVAWMQKAVQFIQFNVLEIAPLSCISSKLSFNVLQQFAIVIGLNAGVVCIFLVILVIRIKYLRRRKSSRSQRDIEEAVLKAKSSAIRNICVFLFASYPKTCTSIIQVLPVNCLSLCFDNQHDHCSLYLRADFSILCSTTPNYTNYSLAAMVFLWYPIGFPLVVMILVWKYASKESTEDENGGQCTDHDVPSSGAFTFTTSSAESPFKDGLRLFSENYKPNCWYWEGLEMIRKLVLVSGLALIGEHSRTQVGLGAIVSALFAVLYVYKRPIRNNFENLLQTISLMAIFLNLGIGTMLKSSDNSDDITVNKHNDNIGVSVLLIIINTLVIGLVIGTVSKAIITKCTKCCHGPHHTSCFGRVKACMSCCKSCCLSLLLIQETSSGTFTSDSRERDALINESRGV